MKKQVFFLFILFLLVSCSADLEHKNPYDPETRPELQARGTLSGRVILEGESDFSAVPVKLVGIDSNHGAETTTNKDGSFMIPDVIPGKYRLVVSERFFEEETYEVNIGIGEQKSVGEILLPVMKYRVTGRVILQQLNQNEEESPSGTLVIFQRVGGVKSMGNLQPSAFSPEQYQSVATTGTYITTADGNGVFAADDIPAGVYDILVQHEGYPPRSLNGIVIGSEDSEEEYLGEIYLPKVSGTFQIIGFTPDETGQFSVENYYYTATRSVRLNLYGFSAVKMKVGNEVAGQCEYGEWEDFVAEKDWLLSPGDGEKVVCVRFQDAAGNETDDLFGRIFLDTTPPKILVLKIIDNGETETYGDTVYFRGSGDLPIEATVVDGESGMNEMKIVQDDSSANWDAYRQFFSVTITGEGRHTLSACFRDYAHNITCSALTLIKDSIPPEGTPPIITNAFDNGKVNSIVVQLHIDSFSPDVKAIYLSNTASFAGSYPVEPSHDLMWYLIPGDGVKTVYLKYVDYAGNESQIYSVTVTLDTTPPSVPDLWRTGFYPRVITMEWSHVDDSDVSYYELQRKIYGLDTSYVTIANKIPAGQFSYSDSGIIPGYRYYYRIRAVDDVGNVSQWSAPFNAGTPIDPFPWAFYVQTRRSGNVIWQLPRGTILTMGSSYHYVLPGLYGEDVLSVNATLYSFTLTTPQDDRIFSYLKVRNQNTEGDMIWENRIYYGIDDEKLSSFCTGRLPFRDPGGNLHYLCLNYAGLNFYIYHLYPVGSTWATEFVFSDSGALNGLDAVYDSEDELRVFVSYSDNVELPDFVLYELIKEGDKWVKYTFVDPGDSYLRGFDIERDSVGDLHAAWIMEDDIGEMTLYYSANITTLVNDYTTVTTCPASFLRPMKLLISKEDSPIILHSFCSPDGYSNHLSESVFDGAGWYTHEITRGILTAATVGRDGKVEILYDWLSTPNYYSDHYAFYGEKDDAGWKFMKVHDTPVSGNMGTLMSTIFGDVFVETYGRDDSTIYLSYLLQGRKEFETIRLLKQNIGSIKLVDGFGREFSSIYRNEDDSRLHEMKIDYFSHLPVLIYDYTGSGGWESNAVFSDDRDLYVVYEAEDTDGYEYLHLNRLSVSSMETRIISPEVNYIRVGKFVRGMMVDGRIHLFYLHQRSSTDLMELVHLYGMDSDWTLDVIDSRVSSDLSGHGLGFPDFAVAHYGKTFYVFYYDAPQQLNLAWSSYPYTYWQTRTLVPDIEQGVTGLGLHVGKEGIDAIYIYRGDDGIYRMKLLNALSPDDAFTREELPLPLGVGNVEMEYVDDTLHLFYNGGDEDLIHAYRVDGKWRWEIVDSNGNAGQYLSVTVDNRGLFHLAYRSDSTTGLFVKYAFGSTGHWKSFVMDDVWNPRNTSIAIFDHRPYMTYIYGEQSGLEQLRLLSPGRYLPLENSRVGE